LLAVLIYGGGNYKFQCSYLQKENFLVH